jgi:predicted amidophosphoribosyltransferase
MDIKTCKFCRKKFQGYTALCPTCAEQLDDKYLIVRNYLDRNSASNISRIAEETEVDEKSLLYLMREGRLAIKSEGSAMFSCLGCGAPILSGKYCDKCKANLMKNLETTRVAMEKSAAPAPEKPREASESRSKVHILRAE